MNEADDNVELKDGEVLLPAVHESTVTFKSISDLVVYEVISERNNEVMVRFSGYDMKISFNLEQINSVEDIDAAANGCASLFRQIITEQLIDAKQNQ